jgi:hypothetical protein
MYGKIKAVVTVAVLALAAACADRSVLAPDGPSAAKGTTTYPMTFNVTQSYSGGSAQTAAGGTGVITFAGTLQTPTPCYDVTAVNAASRSIVVTVRAADTGNLCTQVITWNTYTGQLTSLAAGSYAFRVEHVLGSRTTTAWSGTVVVR